MNKLEKLFESVAPAVKRFVYGRFGSSRDREDILQEAYIEVWQGLRKFDETKKRAKVLPWSMKAARLAALGYIQRNSSWVPPYELEKLKWLNKLDDLIKQIQLDPENLDLMEMLSRHLEGTKDFGGMPAEELALRLQTIQETDRLKDLSGLSIEEWVRIRGYALQGEVGSLYQRIGEEGETILEVLPDKEGKPEAQKLRPILQNAIEQLSTDKQIIICLYDLLGMSMEEVAYIDARGRTVQALYLARQNALDDLREILRKDAEARNREKGREGPERDASPKEVLGALL